jgi:hypothetical protein
MGGGDGGILGLRLGTLFAYMAGSSFFPDLDINRITFDQPCLKQSEKRKGKMTWGGHERRDTLWGERASFFATEFFFSFQWFRIELSRNVI